MNIKDTINARRTSKVLGNPDTAPEPEGQSREFVDELLSVAGNAQFHHPSERAHHGALASPVPWRVYKLDGAGCRAFMHQLAKLEGHSDKIPAMLAAAEFLFQVTWLPDAPNECDQLPEGMLYSGNLRNMEHVAAASAMTQSMLLAATDAGFRTYWSSGGVLRSLEVFELLGIPSCEILLGSVFLYPQDVGDAEIKSGKLHDKRGVINDWSVWRDVDI